MKHILTAILISFVMTLIALEWKLPGEAWTRIDPSAAWSFMAAPRKGGEWTALAQKDFNPAANRLMFSEANGDVWSLPSVRLLNFSLPGQQLLEMQTHASADPVIVFNCFAAGELEYELFVTDPVPADGPGADGNALFLTGKISGGKEEILEQFSFRGKQGELHTKSVSVKAGDRIFFRKSASAADDFGRRACRVAIKVRLTETAGGTGMTAFLIPSDRILLQDSVAVEGFRGDKPLPTAAVKKMAGGEFEITARAEKNAASSYGCGDIVLCWRAPESGAYQISVEAENPGLDVKGGDGGTVGVYYLPPGAGMFGASSLTLRLPASRKEFSPPQKGRVSLKLDANDQLGFRFNAGADGYGDLFKMKLKIEPANEGITPEFPTPEGLLPAVPAQARSKGVPPRKGLFWLGTSGGWLTGPYAAQSLELIRKFIPELALIGVGSRPDLWPEQSFDIPVLVQSFGAGFEPYWRVEGAFEHDYSGICHAEKSNVALSGMAHAAAIPHPAVIKAFDRLARSSVRNGYSGYGFNDMVWFWGPGRGNSGYNPETVKAFIESLKGEDEGFRAGWGNAEPNRFLFKDYVKFYLGVEPRPEFLNLKSWDEYRPLSRNEQLKRRKEGTDITAELMLFDMLVHYEWLKAADRIGRAAKEEGGIFQVLPNPEDLANGCDFLFLAGLSNVYLKTEEYFQTPLIMNGIYYRFPYFRDRTAEGTETGIVLEGGGGGNGVPYYTVETSLKMAYESTIAAESDHLEADFWPSHRLKLEDAVKNETVRNRFGAILAYGLGFKYGREDAAIRRLEPSFVSITSRRIFRPWGTAYRPWNWFLDTGHSPDQLLARMGYAFAGRGEEALQEKDFAADTVFFSANPATEFGWKRFMELLESGRIKHGIVMRDAMVTRIGGTMRPVAVAPEESARSRKVGKGILYCLDADGKEYRKLLDSLRIVPGWESRDPVEARLYRGGDVMLVSAMRYDVLPKRKDGLYPVEAESDAALKVRVAAGKRYAVVTFPGLRRMTVTADGDGLAELSLGRASYELFFLVPGDGEALYAKLKARADEFRCAMTLDGMTEPAK